LLGGGIVLDTATPVAVDEYNKVSSLLALEGRKISVSAFADQVCQLLKINSGADGKRRIGRPEVHETAIY